MPQRIILFSTMLLCLGQMLAPNCFADDTAGNYLTPNYHWGRGLRLPQFNLTIGGYANITYKHYERQKDTFTFDDLSLFITWTPLARLRFFTEFELEDTFSNQGIAKSDQTFSLERLYVDFLASESLTLRLGKFLTPVGLWNVIHAAPLVWTTSRPLVTEGNIFDSHATGLMVRKNFLLNEQDLEISLYLDDSNDLDPLPNAEEFKNAFGAHVNYQLSNYLQLGASYVGFKKRADQSLSRNHLFGLDLFWMRNRYEIQMEFVYRHANDLQGNETGFYIQGVAPLKHNFFAVGRYEFLDGTHRTNDVMSDSTINLGVAGLAWRPYVPLVVKAEYRFGSDDYQIAPNGFFSSIAFFF